MTDTPVRWRAGVRGDPIEHSLSPVLHRAAYRALHLSDWSYDRQLLAAGELAAHVANLDVSWRGLSLTMPLKEAAFDVVHTVSAVARQVGAINTLVRDERGWSGHNTDVAGIVAALRSAGLAGNGPVRAVVVGAGATARSALAALAELGAGEVTLMVRTDARVPTRELADRLGLTTRSASMGSWPSRVDVIVGTTPAAAYAGHVEGLPPAGAGALVLDCVYGRWPSPLLQAAAARGYAAVPGTEMLLHQAVEQVRLMTGHPGPTAAMRAALRAALEEAGRAGRDGAGGAR